MRRLVLTGLIMLAGAASAQTPLAPVVTSAAPEGLSVTIYRDPDRSSGAFDLNWLQGYALVTETREITIPAGRATIRFEGVAAGMLPESAIVSGLPAGVREKNLDAALLSPRNLFARSYGRPVVLRRQHEASGKVTEERAIIRSAPDGGVIVQTAKGFEAANCGPLNDELVYTELPAGLSPQPTLSIETDSPVAARAKLTLSYLAWGFDWQANYVVRLRPDGRQGEMTAWVTLANSDPTSFPGAQAAVVAGKPNFDETRDGGALDDGSGVLTYHCYLAPPVPVMPQMMGMAVPASAMVLMEKADIMVTARRRDEKDYTVAQENLGDLKLYRLPVATTIAARASKQVALFTGRSVTFTPYYAAWIGDEGSRAATIGMRTRNRPQDGLGIALPAGPVRVFAAHGDEFLLLGGDGLTDKAVGETVEIGAGTTAQVQVVTKAADARGLWRDTVVTVSNANPFAVRFEGNLATDDNERIISHSAPLVRKDGHWQWAAQVPANGRAVLRYRLQRAN